MANSDLDPARAGLVASLARPGGNLTGFTGISSALSGKRLEMLTETLPIVSHVAVLWDPDSRAAAGLVRETRIAARSLKLKIRTLEVWDEGEVDVAFRTAAKERAQALVVISSGVMAGLQAKIISLAAKARLPVMYTNTLWAMNGGLLAFGTNVPEQYRQSAAYVDKILKGTKPADLPVQQPTKFEFVINLKAAKQIGLTIPQSVLARADKVIQ
jgi:putative ABC transport system substrate-binding protein